MGRRSTGAFSGDLGVIVGCSADALVLSCSIRDSDAHLVSALDMHV